MPFNRMLLLKLIGNINKYELNMNWNHKNMNRHPSNMNKNPRFSIGIETINHLKPRPTRRGGGGEREGGHPPPRQKRKGGGSFVEAHYPVYGLWPWGNSERSGRRGCMTKARSDASRSY